MRIQTPSIYLLIFIAIPCFTLADIKMKPSPVCCLGEPKIADGSMNEWSPLGGPGGHGTVDNEWYIYDSGDDYWIDPQGGPMDEPLSIMVVEDHPITSLPEPVACGLNLLGVYLCYEPHRNGVSVTAALDLPLSSNPDVSPDYVHPYNDLPPGNMTFYPVAFDVDGNGDPATVNSLDYFPAGGNGFNFIKPGGLIFDDRSAEEYKIRIYFGDDDIPASSKNGRSPPGMDGLLVMITLESEYGIIMPPRAVIPGSQTKNGMDLDLVATYGPGIIEVGGHNNPDPISNPRIVDIEVKINQLQMIIEDPIYIDWAKVPVGKLKVDDLRKIFINAKSGSLDDMSAEHLVNGGHIFPVVSIKKAK